MSPEPRESGPPPERPIGALRVLLVDDNSSIRRLLGDLCRASGCVTATASTAEQAVELLGHDEFDVVFSDVRMPGLDGFDLLDAVSERQPSASVVLITGAPSSAEAALGRGRGAYDYLAKPFTSAEVKRLLDRLRSYRTRRPQGVKP